jgi:hypothetical protein
MGEINNLTTAPFLYFAKSISHGPFLKPSQFVQRRSGDPSQANNDARVHDLQLSLKKTGTGAEHFAIRLTILPAVLIRLPAGKAFHDGRLIDGVIKLGGLDSTVC